MGTNLIRAPKRNTISRATTKGRADARHCTPQRGHAKTGWLGPMREGQYDLDQQANGVCTFGFFCLEVCGSLVESVVVPVGQSRLVERGNLSGITVKLYTLHCERSP